MITIKSAEQIELMRKAGAVVKEVLDSLEDFVKAGRTTYEINQFAHNIITKCGAKPSFLGYNGYPASVCVSINEEVVHGIPSRHVVVKEGDIVSCDVGSILNGWQGDAARTYMIGDVGEVKRKLVEVCKQSFFEGMKVLRAGARLGDLGYAIQRYVESNGFSVVRDLIGHGIGTEMHEEPNVPNYGIPGRGTRLQAGMTIAVEPMINVGTYKVSMLDDGWTIVTKDGLPSAHYENTVVITEDGVEILTL